MSRYLIARRGGARDLDRLWFGLGDPLTRSLSAPDCPVGRAAPHPAGEPRTRYRKNKYPFAVECKYRNCFKEGKIDWAKPKQIIKYEEFQNKRAMVGENEATQCWEGFGKY